MLTRKQIDPKGEKSVWVVEHRVGDIWRLSDCPTFLTYREALNKCKTLDRKYGICGIIGKYRPMLYVSAELVESVKK